MPLRWFILQPNTCITRVVHSVMGLWSNALNKKALICSKRTRCDPSPFSHPSWQLKASCWGIPCRRHMFDNNTDSKISKRPLHLVLPPLRLLTFVTWHLAKTKMPNKQCTARNRTTPQPAICVSQQGKTRRSGQRRPDGTPTMLDPGFQCCAHLRAVSTMCPDCRYQKRTKHTVKACVSCITVPSQAALNIWNVLLTAWN